MKFKNAAVTRTAEILYNDHYVAIPYDLGEIEPNEEGIIPAGTIVHDNHDFPLGVLLHDVKPIDNPNGTVVVHGFIKASKLPVYPGKTEMDMLGSRIIFMEDDGTIYVHVE